jgi:hypothetical protein
MSQRLGSWLLPDGVPDGRQIFRRGRVAQPHILEMQHHHGEADQVGPPGDAQQIPASLQSEKGVVVPAGEFEEPLASGQVQAQPGQAVDVPHRPHHARIVEQQVRRRGRRPAGGFVLHGPGMQAVALFRQPDRAEFVGRGRLQGVVGEEPAGSAYARGRQHARVERPPLDPVQNRPDLERRPAGEIRQVLDGQWCVRRDQQADDLTRQRRAGEQAGQLETGGPGGRDGVARRLDLVPDSLLQPVVARQVGRDRAAEPRRDDDLQPGCRPSGQQRGDARRLRCGAGTTVLVEPVHDQHEATSAGASRRHGSVEFVRPTTLPLAGRQLLGRRLAEQHRDLAHDRWQEVGARRLAGETADDEERQHLHVGRRPGGEPGQKGRLTGVRECLHP